MLLGFAGSVVGLPEVYGWTLQTSTGTWTLQTRWGFEPAEMQNSWRVNSSGATAVTPPAFTPLGNSSPPMTMLSAATPCTAAAKYSIIVR